MKGINIWLADNFVERAKSVMTEVIESDKKTWCISRPIGRFGIIFRIKCALEVFKGKADIIRFYKQ